MTQEKKYTAPNYHMLNAFYNWIIENDGAPHIVVPLDCVPVHLKRLGKDGTILLNISPRAVGYFSLDKDELSFNARFSGVDTRLNIPVGQILAIFDRDQPGVVMNFEQATVAEVEAREEPAAKRPTLSVVK